MLEDDIFVSESSWIKDRPDRTIAKLPEASFEGWIYCRSHVTECTNMVLKHGRRSAVDTRLGR